MNTKSTCALVLGTVFFLLFVSIWIPYNALWPVVTPGGTPVGIAIWGGRAFETLFQGFILLAGVLSILLLVRTDAVGRRPP